MHVPEGSLSVRVPCPAVYSDGSLGFELGAALDHVLFDDVGPCGGVVVDDGRRNE